MSTTNPLITTAGEFAAARVGELIVTSAKAQISDSDWREHCKNVQMLASRDAPARAMVIFAHGTGPNTKQRQYLADEYGKSITDLRVALLTDSTVARGVLSAVGWLLNTKVKAYSHRQLDDALAWLGAWAKFNPAEARSTLIQLIPAVGGNSAALG